MTKKFNINIKQENIYGELETIVDIDINRGNWKYWDRYFQNREKIKLTINNIHDVTIVNMPVKDAVPIWDMDIWENERELIVKDACIRTYDNLLSYLNCRIDNMKELNKKYGRMHENWTAVLFEREIVRNKDNAVVRDIKYEQEDLIEICIKVVE